MRLEGGEKSRLGLEKAADEFDRAACREERRESLRTARLADQPTQAIHDKCKAIRRDDQLHAAQADIATSDFVEKHLNARAAEKDVHQIWVIANHTAEGITDRRVFEAIDVLTVV